MKQKFVSTLLAAALTLSLCSGPALAYAEEYTSYSPEAQQQYTDVPTTHWAFQSIDTCSQRDWFGGYPDGTFQPTNKIRRDEAAKVFAIALSLSIEKNPTVTYSDTQDNWAKAYIEATKNLFPNTTTLAGTESFRPEQTITREETIYALVVAWRYASETENADLSILNMFSDKNSISAAVKPYVAVAVEEGLISGIPDGKGGSTIQGQTGLSRAEFATLLARALEHGIGEDDTKAPVITLDSYPSTTGDASVTVTGKVSGSLETLTQDGKAVNVGKDGTFSLALSLSEGDNRFALKAVNKYQNGSSATISITRNSAKPSIRLLSKVPTETTQGSLTVNGVVNTWSNDCTLLLNNSRLTVDPQGFFEAALTLKEGENSFVLEVVQGGNTSASHTIQVTRLTTAGAGEWLEKLPAGVTAANFTVKEKTQYRTMTREIKTSTESSMAGWNLVSAGGQWGDWSSWQSTPVTGSDTRKVETQSVKVSDGKTQYRYSAYVGTLNSAGANRPTVTAGVGGQWRHFSSAWMQSFTTNYWTDSTPWMDSPLSRVPNWNQVYAGQSSNKYTYDGKVYYTEETQTTEDVYETQYRYQDFSGSNVFEKWSDWSDWSDTETKQNDNTKVETRIMYQFSPKA